MNEVRKLIDISLPEEMVVTAAGTPTPYLQLVIDKEAIPPEIMPMFHAFMECVQLQQAVRFIGADGGLKVEYRAVPINLKQPAAVDPQSKIAELTQKVAELQAKVQPVEAQAVEAELITPKEVGN